MSEAFKLDDKHFTNAGIDLTQDTSNADEQQVQTQDTTTQGGDTQTSSTTQAPDQVQGATGKDSTSNQSNDGTQQGKKQEGQSAPDPELKPGDIRLNDGSIVRAGAERRHFENARRFRDESQVLKNDLNTANQKFNTLQARYQELSSSVQAIGLENPQQVTSAVRLYKDLSSDPVGTVTKLLAELKALGHTFDGIGGAVDTLAIQHTIDARLPQQQDGPTPEQQLQVIQEEANRETAQFLQTFPDANIHQEMMAAVIQAETQAGRVADLRDVYFKLREAAINQGLDWSQPLGPQIQARRQAPQQQQQQRPITGGRQVPVANTENLDPFKSQNNSKDDVILAAMRDAGYNYTR